MQNVTLPCFRPRQSRAFTVLTFLTMLVAFALTGTISMAQSTQGVILGAVKDSAGAVVPGATVTLTNTDAGIVRTTKSSASGDFQFSEVAAAHYDLTVEAPGFQKWSTSGVVLSVRQQLRLDATLGIGTVQQEVSVNGEAASAIQTETPTISATFNHEDVVNLPVNTRASFNGTSAFNILGTLPGMQADASGFSLQGALPYQTDVTVDGVTVRDPGGSSNLSNAFPSSESINEIRADGSLNSAEYGQPGQVVVTTKGGSNQLHGSDFWYYQNSAFDAIPYAFPTITSKPTSHGDTFGGSIGGPVVIPHLYNGHNKTFFYGGYEGWRHPAQTNVSAKVPSTLMKQGDFSKYTSDSFTGSIVNPFTGENVGKKIPSGSINPIATSILSQFYPDPNVGDPTDYVDNGDDNWQKNVDVSAHSNQFDVRGDQYFGSNQKFQLWGRFSWKDIPANSYSIFNLPSNTQLDQNRVLKIDGSWAIHPNLINDASFGFTRRTYTQSNSFDGKAWTNAQGWVGLQNLYYNGVPQVSFNNIRSLDVDRLDQPSKSYTYDYNDVLIWSKGHHNFKFGVNIQTLEAFSTLGFNGSDNYGTYTFNKSSSTGLFNSIDFADFLFGTPFQSFYDVVSQDNDGVSGRYHAFGQDEWRVSPRLTLSYGIRYELHPGYYDKGGDIGNFDPSHLLSGGIIYPDGKQALLAQAYLASANACNPDGVTNTNDAVINGAPCMPVQTNSQAGFPRGLKKYPHLRFTPRFGFAYRPFANDKWAVRGGFGMYNNTLGGSSFYSLTGTIQANTQYYQNSYNPEAATPATRVGFAWPDIYAGSSGTPTNNYGNDYFGTANGTNWKDPYTYQWSLSVDHDFGSGYGARVSYIGSVSKQLTWSPDENTLPYSSSMSANNAPFSARRFPNWGVVNTRFTGADANYESFQIAASHRMQNGLEFNSTYTFATANANNQGPSAGSFSGENGGQRSTTPLSADVDYGRVYGTRRNLWNTTGLYDLPYGRGRMFGSTIPRAADLIVGGWRLSAIFTVQSGAYVTPYFPDGEGDPSGTGSGLDNSLTGFSLPGRAQHADDVKGVSSKPSGQNRFKWINPGAFTCPGDSSWTPGNPCQTGAGYDSEGNAIGNNPLPIGRFGTSRVGSVEGPGYVNLNTGLVKTFSLSERIKVRAEGTFTNVLNHTNLDGSNLTSSGHLDLSSSSFGIISKGLDARTGQISVRLDF